MRRLRPRRCWAEPRAPDAAGAGVARLGARRGAVADGAARGHPPRRRGLAAARDRARCRRRSLAAVAAHPPARDGRSSSFGALGVRRRRRDARSADGSVGLYTMACVLLLPYALCRWGSRPRDRASGWRSSWWPARVGIVSDCTRCRRGRRRRPCSLLFAGGARARSVRCQTARGSASATRSAAGARAAGRASCTTPSRTTSRPSPSGPRPAGSSRPPPRAPPSTRSPSSRRRPRGRSPRCGRWSASCATASAAELAPQRGRRRPRAARRGDAAAGRGSTSSSSGDLDDLGRRSAPRSTGSRRSRSPTPYGMPGTRPASTSGVAGGRRLRAADRRATTASRRQRPGRSGLRHRRDDRAGHPARRHASRPGRARAAAGRSAPCCRGRVPPR